MQHPDPNPPAPRLPPQEPLPVPGPSSARPNATSTSSTGASRPLARPSLLDTPPGAVNVGAGASGWDVEDGYQAFGAVGSRGTRAGPPRSAFFGLGPAEGASTRTTAGAGFPAPQQQERQQQQLGARDVNSGFALSRGQPRTALAPPPPPPPPPPPARDAFRTPPRARAPVTPPMGAGGSGARGARSAGRGVEGERPGGAEREDGRGARGEDDGEGLPRRFVVNEGGGGGGDAVFGRGVVGDDEDDFDVDADAHDGGGGGGRGGDDDGWGEDDVTLVFAGFGLAVDSQGRAVGPGAGGGGAVGQAEVDHELEWDEAMLAKFERLYTAKFSALPADTWNEVVKPIFDAMREAQAKVEDESHALLHDERALVDLAADVRQYLATDGDELYRTYQEFAARKAVLLQRLDELDRERADKQRAMLGSLDKLAADRKAAKDRHVADLQKLAEQYRKQAAQVVSERENGKEVNHMLKTILGK